ncbi:permease prefix domain 1-containing protein, partial [Actinomadura fibrosa]
MSALRSAPPPAGPEPAGEADPVEDYVAELSAALHGPARAKARLVEEIRGGLADTVDAHAGEGLAYRHAARRAVREFGTPDELVPGCQRELTIAQARHTARVAALTVPFLAACWLLVRSAGHDPYWPLRLLAAQLAGAAAAAGLLSAATL